MAADERSAAGEPGRRVRVLVVDDSRAVRNLFEHALARDPEIEVVGTAQDAFVARDLVQQLQPDVLTLDLEMPGMDGLTFLRELMASRPTPVVVVSSITTAGGAMAMEALDAGAVDVFCKPTSAESVREMLQELTGAVKGAAAARVRHAFRRAAVARKDPLSGATDVLFAIGASTGGTVAIERILCALPKNAPGIVITQHMPPDFTRHFANRLDQLSALDVREARSGDPIVPGVALVAPGDRHLVVRRVGAQLVAEVKDGPRVNRHRPSVDVMFQSVASAVGGRAVGALLTGMGADGAEGLLAMRDAGCRTIAQDEASCVLFGMPRVAIAIGAAELVLPLDAIAPEVLRLADRSVRRS